MHITVVTTIFGLPTGQRIVPMHLALPKTTLTMQELIACKVQQEVAEYAAHQRPGISGEYLSPEELLGASPTVVGTASEEIARAQQAFADRAYMIVIDNQRITEPQAAMTMHPETEVEFIKILPLVGG